MALFSIIVPIYRIEKYLCECVESLLNQTFDDYELILVDDGSPDGCPALCDAYAALDARIKVLHKANGGVVSARKAGLKIATGEYIISVDGDDYVGPNHLSDIAKVIREYTPDVVAFGGTTVGRGESILVKNQIPEGLYVEDKLQFVFSKLLIDPEIRERNWGSICYAIWAKAIKRTLLLEYQMAVPDGISNGEDVAVVIPMLLACERLYVMDMYSYYYRQSEGSITRSFNMRAMEQYAALFEFLYHKLPEKFWKNIDAYAYILIENQSIGSARFFARYQEYHTYMEQVQTGIIEQVIRRNNPCRRSLKEAIIMCTLKARAYWVMWIYYHR